MTVLDEILQRVANAARILMGTLTAVHQGCVRREAVQPGWKGRIATEAVELANKLQHQYLRPTPLYEWPALAQALGCRFYLKHENHTPTTAFKVRGGINLVARLPDDVKRRGVLGCTTGNHGQSLAYACKLFGVRCVLVVPVNANPAKLAAMRALGAE